MTTLKLRKLLNLKKSYIYDLFLLFFLCIRHVISYLFTLCTLPSFDTIYMRLNLFSDLARLAMLPATESILIVI